MAIVRTRSVERVEVYPAQDSSADATTNDAHCSLMVIYEELFDDTSDPELPVATSRVLNLYKFDDEGTATDVTGEDQLVQDICGAIWS